MDSTSPSQSNAMSLTVCVWPLSSPFIQNFWRERLQKCVLPVAMVLSSDALGGRRGEFDDLPGNGNLFRQPVEVAAARSQHETDRDNHGSPNSRSAFCAKACPGLRASNSRITSRALSRSPRRSHVLDRFKYSISSSGATWMPY